MEAAPSLECQRAFTPRVSGVVYFCPMLVCIHVSVCACVSKHILFARECTYRLRLCLYVSIYACLPNMTSVTVCIYAHIRVDH